MGIVEDKTKVVEVSPTSSIADKLADDEYDPNKPAPMLNEIKRSMYFSSLNEFEENNKNKNNEQLTTENSTTENSTVVPTTGGNMLQQAIVPATLVLASNMFGKRKMSLTPKYTKRRSNRRRLNRRKRVSRRFRRGTR